MSVEPSPSPAPVAYGPRLHPFGDRPPAVPPWQRCVACDAPVDSRFGIRLPEGAWRCAPCDGPPRSPLH